MSISKVSVDQAAKDYYKLLWSTYGESLTRDIKRRLKAALVDNKKIAMVDDAAPLTIVAQAKSDDGVIVEGIYKDKNAKLMFRASLDKDANVVELKSFDIR